VSDKQCANAEPKRDLVVRLREWPTAATFTVMPEAADEIERLRAEVKDLNYRLEHAIHANDPNRHW